MNLEKKINQLTDLLVGLTLSVYELVASRRRADKNIDLLVQSQWKADKNIDLLVRSQRKADKNINLLIRSQGTTNLAMGELRQSNLRLADSMEKLTHKIEKVDEFEMRLKKVEDKVFGK